MTRLVQTPIEEALVGILEIAIESDYSTSISTYHIQLT